MPSLGQSSTSTSLEATVSPLPERIKGSRSIEHAHGRVVTDQAMEGKEQGLESHKMAPWPTQPPTCAPPFPRCLHNMSASGVHWPHQTCAA